MGTMIKHMLTEPDNETYDMFRWLALVSIIVALCLEVYVVVIKGQTFDLQNFGTGIGLVFAGTGVALKLKPDSPGGAT